MPPDDDERDFWLDVTELGAVTYVAAPTNRPRHSVRWRLAAGAPSFDATFRVQIPKKNDSTKDR
jgi:hypothetical protein